MDSGKHPTWTCGAFQPTPPQGAEPYRCTEPYDHASDNHRAVIDGEVVATWPRKTG
ncbi:hypothetical protein AB0B48_09035 [Micromonospora sp. NPDC049089]|uniref:hypothetical protein n=1 Tax=Micromonospora sp. NPDC049089 TaxID=3155496 RepID=UPI0033E388B1